MGDFVQKVIAALHFEIAFKQIVLQTDNAVK